MDKNMRCPMCEMSNFKEENGNYVCQICGHKIPATNNDSKPEPTESDKKKTSSTINSFIIGGIILGILGVLIFLGIVFIGLGVYGRVYFYDGYDYTAVLTTTSIIFMIIGFISLLAKFFKR